MQKTVQTERDWQRHLRLNFDKLRGEVIELRNQRPIELAK